MAANSESRKVEERRLDDARGKSVADLAGDVLNEIANLLQIELQLLRAEISEKLTFTGLSVGLVGAGALLLMASAVLLLQAAIAGLVAYGVSWPISILLVAGFTLLLGAGLTWLGINGLSLKRLAPSKTLAQLHKDAHIANIR